MMMINSKGHGAQAMRGVLTRISLIFVALLAACDTADNLLDVETPGRIPAGELDNPIFAELLVSGAVGDFDCAYGAYVVLSGILSDELIDATQTASRWPYDRRDVDPTQDRLYAESSCVGLGVYTPLSAARWSAENILRNLEGWTQAELPAAVDREELLATAAAYSGYSHLLLGEGFCSGVLLDENLEPTGEVSREELFQRAEQRFTRAIEAAQASGNDELLNMALVGRARTRLDLGDQAGALADAMEVEENFVKVATASGASERRENRVFEQSNPVDGFAVSVGDDYRNMSFGGVPDPRVPVVATGVTSPTDVDVFAQTKYESLGDPIPIATWDETQLIIAEIEGGQTALDIINMFHQRAGLPEFTSSDPDAIQAHIIGERRRELFLEGHRFFDIERLDLPLDPPPGTPFFNGGVYGSTTCLPLPDIERLNNPNIDG